MSDDSVHRIETITYRPASKWSWSFGPRFTIRFTPEEGDEANWFYRWTQRVILGIYWRRDP